MRTYVQRKPATNVIGPQLAPSRGLGPAPEGVHPAVLRPSTGGTPLPPPVRAKMEGALGHDFSNVRVHQGDEAPSIGALAFARGSHVHFAPGQYRPHSADGQRILAHELTHVIQQGEGRVRSPGGAVPINDDARLESEADRAWERSIRSSNSVSASFDPTTVPTGLGPMQRVPRDKEEGENDKGGEKVRSKDRSSSPKKRSKSSRDASRNKEKGHSTERVKPPKKNGKDNRDVSREKTKVHSPERVKPSPWEEKLKEMGTTIAKLDGLQTDKTRKWYGLGGARNYKLVNIPLKNVPEPGKPARLKKIFAEDPYLQQPRSFEGERSAQALRWISTLLHLHVKKTLQEDPREVQTSLSRKKLFTSSNMNSGNIFLADKAKGMTAGKYLGDLVKIYEPDEIKPYKEKGNALSRTGRHIAKVKFLLSSLESGSIKPEYAELAEALTKPFEVTPELPGEDGLHAERRLARKLDKDFHDAITRGTMRPCAVCYTKLYAGKPGPHPKHAGGHWPSLAATKEFAEDDYKTLANIPSTASQPADNPEAAPRFDQDTDSNTDDEHKPIVK